MKKNVFLGHAVKDGHLRFTSVSAIKLFDVRKDGCKRKWAYKYLFGKKTLKTKAQKAGIFYAEKLEHYLTTGEDVLPPVLQQAKRYFPSPKNPVTGLFDLECEQSLGDMERALASRDAAFKAPAGSDAQKLLFEEAKRFAGLHANGVPIDGAADIRHVRGEYIDKSGIVCKESSDVRVVNIADLKVVSQIFPHRITTGEKKGQIRMPFTLTDAEIANDVQMLGYARHAVNKYDWMTHARLSLIYTNSTKKEADLRMAFVSRQQIIDRWHGDIEPIVADMEKTCGAQKPEEIEPNLNACDAFTHIDPTDPDGKRVLQGCPHRYYCSRPAEQVCAMIFGGHKEHSMSLFDSPNQSSIPAPPSSPSPVLTDPAAYAVQVAAEKEKLLQCLPAPPSPLVTSYGFCSKCGTALTSENASRLTTGEVKHIGCSAASLPPPPPPPSPIAVSPPDQPRAQTMLQAAAPVPAHAIAEIQNPKLRAEVEEHARQHAEKARLEAEAAMQQKTPFSVWCNASETKIIITADIAVSGKWICHCGKSYRVKSLKPIKNSNGDMEIVIPRHRLPKNESEEPAAAPIDNSDEVEKKSAAMVVMQPSPPSTSRLPPEQHVMVVPVSSDVTTTTTTAFVNGNGNGKHVEDAVSRMQQDLAVFVVEVQLSRVKIAELSTYQIIAASMSDALARVLKLGGNVEVLSIKKLPGMVLL